jgi:membrane protease YdiL (CAAX protease family)
MKSLIRALEFDRARIHDYVILLSAPVLLSVYWCYGRGATLQRFMPDLAADPLGGYYGTIWQFISFFILTFLLPVIYIMAVMRKPLKEFGFRIGDWKFGLGFIAVSVPLLLVPIIFMASKVPEVRAEYPLARILFDRHDLILWYELAYVLFYYVAWEFFFRGFLLFGLKDRFGAMNAVLIQTISSCLIHLGKPESEIFGSIFIGLLFGAIALKTRSVWYVIFLHAAVGVTTDLFVLLL